MRLVTTALLGALSVGCYTMPAGHLSLLSTRRYPIDIEILAPKVEAKNCVTYGPVLFPAELPHLGVAIEKAIRSTPGANSLANVSIFYEEVDLFLLKRFCYRVVGDAARFP